MPLTARRWKSADGETLGSLSALVLQTYAGNREHGVKEEGRKDRIRKQGEQKAERSHLCVLPSQAGVLLGGGHWCLQVPPALCLSLPIKRGCLCSHYRGAVTINYVTCSCKLYGAFQKPKGLLIINQYS